MSPAVTDMPYTAKKVSEAETCVADKIDSSRNPTSEQSVAPATDTVQSTTTTSWMRLWHQTTTSLWQRAPVAQLPAHEDSVPPTPNRDQVSDALSPTTLALSQVRLVHCSI